ncbi:MAG: carboxypeptidase regulatory-like domain-containing protein, partial [Candidatus Nanohaloarchaea archaeon]
KGKLRVYTGEVNQDGPTYVDVEVDGKTENTGSNDLAIFNLNQGSYTVSASANGEYSEESVYLSSGETETVYLGLPADNGEDKAVLTVNTMSGGEKLRYVDVTVNGETKSTGSDGTAVFRLESGGYEIDAEKDGYIDASRGVYLSQGEEQEETLQLEKKDVDKECEISVGRVQISDKTISKGESTEVSLRIDSGSVKQDFQVFADTEESTYMDKTITVDGVRTITKTVTPENDVKVYTQVEAVGSPCGYEKWESSDEIIVSSTGEDEENKLTVDVEDRDGDNIENAEVRISNGADREKETDENGRARFELENGDYELEVSKEGYRDITREFSINGEDKELDITLSKIDGEEEDKGHFTARVVNQNGDRLEDARVKVENDDSITKWTSDDGEASFNLEPGDYEVTVWKPGYTTRTDEIEIEEDDDFTRGYKLHKEQDLKVSSLNYPETVCRGSSMSVSFQVENQGNSKEVIDISGEGLGSSINGRSLILDAGEEKRTSIIFTNIQGSGSESFTVKASNTDSDTGSGTVNVESCGITNYGQASDISLSINPDRALSGRPVQVKGYVDGAQGRSEVTVKVDGKKVGEVSTQPDGYFQTYIRVSQVGMHSVSVETDSISANRNLEVLPTVSATMIDPPREVFEGEEFELCAQINSQINPKVVLLRDGVVMQTRQASGKVCFTPTASNPGEHEYMIRAVTYGEGTAATARIKVLETGPETTSFPESIASVESESGVVKAEIYNTHDELRRYHIKLEGLPDGWVSTSEKEVVLSKGERDTVYFYVMPKEEGSYSGDIVIESDGSEIYRENVTVWSGGTKKDQSKTWIGKLKKLWPF